ncbi:hypothetical protein DFH07DRAFT_76462 [Mycena maculata]|uniref:Uncharacterized protein n=1 Tax=Mycena maculata TaxID=230809 RepID=A0AAD7IDV2_9AGAR|nr:hypothetical protein DFH07DRAFT_76462 [Mycena maculata]
MNAISKRYASGSGRESPKTPGIIRINSHLSEVVNTNLTTPSQICSVRARRGRASFGHPSSGSSLIRSSHCRAQKTTCRRQHTARRLSTVLQRRADIFYSVDVKLERARAPLASKHDVDLGKRTILRKSSTEAGNNRSP